MTSQNIAEDEELDAGLVPYLEPITGINGQQMLRAPLVYSLPHLPALNSRVNRIYRHKLLALSQAEQTGDWWRCIVLHERAFRLKAFLDYADQMSDYEYWSNAADVYVDSENADQYFKTWCSVVSENRRKKRHFMNATERKALEQLPDEITVYRGCTEKAIRDLSWTTCRDMATWFANRFTRGGFVLQGRVKKSDVIGYLTRRNEFEIVALPWHVVIDANFSA